jgi:hypothetical protein
MNHMLLSSGWEADATRTATCHSRTIECRPLGCATPTFFPLRAFDAVVGARLIRTLYVDPYLFGWVPMTVLACQYPTRVETFSDLATDDPISGIRRHRLSFHLAPRCHRGRAFDSQRFFVRANNHHAGHQDSVPLHLSQDVSRNPDPDQTDFSLRAHEGAMSPICVVKSAGRRATDVAPNFPPETTGEHASYQI